MPLFRFKASVEIWVIASDLETAESTLNEHENMLEWASAYRFDKAHHIE
jgi:hypothetical protein